MGFQNWISTTYFTLETKNLNILSTFLFKRFSQYLCQSVRACFLLPFTYIVMGVGYHSALKIEKPVVVSEIQIDIFGFFFHFHKSLLHPKMFFKNCLFLDFFEEILSSQNFQFLFVFQSIV